MSKSMIAKVLVSVMVVALLSGCAAFNKGPSDLDLVKARVAAFREAMLAHKVPEVLACLSDSFYHPEVGGKKDIEPQLKQVFEGGMVQDGQIDLAKAEYKIEKDKATVYPITASAAPGSVTVGLTLKKEKGPDKKPAWFISEVNVEGI